MNQWDPLKKITQGILLLCAITAGSHRSAAQIIYTAAGNGTMGYGGDGAAAKSAKVNQPIGAAMDAVGNLYIADGGNDRIRQVNTAGVITTIAGGTLIGFGGDGGPATAAQFQGIYGVAVWAGNVYISDGNNNRIRRVDPSGIVSTIGGTGPSGYSGDGGPATIARIANPKGLAADETGNVYIADYDNSCIRKIDNLGIITTIAGNGTPGHTGDGGPATAALLNYPYDVAVDKAGNIYITDFANFRVRKIDPYGIITTFAGGGSFYPGDGHPATAASLTGPSGITVDGWGNVFIADIGSPIKTNTRIWMVDPSGIINTIAGIGTAGYAGDGGPATAAELNQPFGMATDVCGTLYVADLGNNRVRAVTYPVAPIMPTISLAGISAAPAGATVTVTATVGSAGGSYDIYWYNNSTLFATTTTPTTTYTKGVGIDTITALVAPTGYGCYGSTTSAPHLVSNSSLGAGIISGVDRVAIWPNPAGGAVHVGVSDGLATGQVMVYNLMGQAVMTETWKGKETTLNISRLAAGVYIVTVTDDAGKRAIGRLVKE